MKEFLLYCKDRRRPLAAFALCTAAFYGIFALYRLPLSAVLYGFLVCGAGLLACAICDFLRYLRRHHLLVQLQQEILNTADNLPTPANVLEADWERLIRALFQAKEKLRAEQTRKYQAMTDYYTLWAHQIKTPIAAMDLMLQTSHLAEAQDMQHELLQIQQYVDMVLGYLRLDSDSSDYLFAHYQLDIIIRQALRKFAPSFIRKRLQLHYEPASCTILTDEKWLLFVLEQVLSNAIKYTPAGSVTLRLRQPCTLEITDTGLGIAPEDLPRVFDRGFTGQLGRADAHATGIGLYLCRRILGQLGHTIAIESQPNQGTTVLIGLERRELFPE